MQVNWMVQAGVTARAVHPALVKTVEDAEGNSSSSQQLGGDCSCLVLQLGSVVTSHLPRLPGSEGPGAACCLGEECGG